MYTNTNTGIGTWSMPRKLLRHRLLSLSMKCIGYNETFSLFNFFWIRIYNLHESYWECIDNKYKMLFFFFLLFKCFNIDQRVCSFTCVLPPSGSLFLHGSLLVFFVFKFQDWDGMTMPWLYFELYSSSSSIHTSKRVTQSVAQSIEQA